MAPPALRMSQSRAEGGAAQGLHGGSGGGRSHSWRMLAWLASFRLPPACPVSSPVCGCPITTSFVFLVFRRRWFSSAMTPLDSCSPESFRRWHSPEWSLKADEESGNRSAAKPPCCRPPPRKHSPGTFTSLNWSLTRQRGISCSISWLITLKLTENTHLEYWKKSNTGPIYSIFHFIVL